MVSLMTPCVNRSSQPLKPPRPINMRPIMPGMTTTPVIPGCVSAQQTPLDPAPTAVVRRTGRCRRSGRGPPLWDGADAQVGEGVEPVPGWGEGCQAAPSFEVDQRIGWLGDSTARWPVTWPNCPRRPDIPAAAAPAPRPRCSRGRWSVWAGPLPENWPTGPGRPAGAAAAHVRQ